MDQEVVQGCCKSVDSLLNSSHDHFGFHQGKNGIVMMEVEVPKRHVLRPNKSTDMVQQVLRIERQERWSSRKNQGLWKKMLF